MKQLWQTKSVFFLSLILAGLLFLLTISFYGSVFATNDDYRMRQLVSGEYSGTPVAETVFMGYPAAFLLSSLYGITDNVPWYGIAVLLCLLIPCTIFFYHILERHIHMGHSAAAFGFCLLMFLFCVQKHIILPQFTLAAAFPLCGALILLWRIPDSEHPVADILGCAVLCGISSVVRFKVFLMLCPFLLLEMIFRMLTPSCLNRVGTVFLSRFLPCLLLCFSLCAGLSVIGESQQQLSESYLAFNEARSNVYDYGSLPPYDTVLGAYQAAGITRGMYYAISARYLDMVTEVDADALTAAAELSGTDKGSLAERLTASFSALFSQFLEGSVVYQTMFIGTALLVLLCFSVFRERPEITALLLAAAAGALAEMGYFCFIGRVMDRLTDVLLIGLCAVLLAVCPELYPIGMSGAQERKKSPAILLRNIVLTLCAAACLACMLVGNQSRLAARAESQHQINERLSVLNAYAKTTPELFYFYDAYDFIACSDNVLSTGCGKMNTDSLGNWYVQSDDYFSRNEQYGFTHAAEGLAGGRAVYAAIGPLKQGILYTMREQYGVEPVRYLSIPYGSNNINLYRMELIGSSER